MNVVSIGGFGHSVMVFNDMVDMDGIQLVGMAPAYPGEDVSHFASHPVCTGAAHFNSVAELLEVTQPAVAIISTRLDCIPKAIIAAANAGCHIITEKPLALDPETLDSVRQAITENGVSLMAMLSMRSEPEFVTARALYSSGAIGEVVLVNGRKSYKYGTRPQWFGDAELYGGTIGWVGIHAVDFINFVTGMEFTQVASMKGNFAHAERAACEDNCALVLAMANGGHATVSVDLFRPEAAPTHGDDWIRVVGTKGIIEARTSDGTCNVIAEDGEMKDIPLLPKAPIFREFLQSIANGNPSTRETDIAFHLTQTCLIARDAAEKKSVLTIPS